MDVPLVQIGVASLQPQQLSPSKASCKVDLVDLKHAAAPGLLEESTQTLRQQDFHFLPLQLWQDTAFHRLLGISFCSTAQFRAEEITWLMLRTILTLRPFGLFRDSVHSTRPFSSRCLYSH